jgi:hypothetical protein
MSQPQLIPPTRDELLEQLRQLREQGVGTVAAAAAVEKEATRKLAEAVAAARDAGASWQDVADAAGVSRQAAQQRWGRING